VIAAQNPPGQSPNAVNQSAEKVTALQRNPEPLSPRKAWGGLLAIVGGGRTLLLFSAAGAQL
jgi:hypothetical protein